MRFYKYIPGNKTCLEVPLSPHESVSFLPNETVWLSSEEEDHFLRHELVRQLIKEGKLIAFFPEKQSASVISNYSLDDARQIVSGLYDTGLLKEMLLSEKKEYFAEHKKILKDQIVKLEGSLLAKHHPLSLSESPPRKRYPSEIKRRRKKKPKDIHEAASEFLLEKAKESA